MSLDDIAIPDGYFKARYHLKGRKDWIRTISPEDRAALARLAFEKSDYGKRGDRARASTAKRYPKGHELAGQFMPN